MIYFLVNNNYHITDFNNLYQDIIDLGISLIQVPHTLNLIKSDKRFKTIHTFNKFDIYKLHIITSLRKNRNLFKKIDAELSIGKDDILFAYTEYDLTNQYIIKKFHHTGAKVYLLEDGTATAYLFMSMRPKTNIKNIFKMLLLTLLYGLKETRLLFNGISTYPTLKDKYIDGVCFYLPPSKITRNIKGYTIKNNTKIIESLDDHSAIFLSQPIYHWFNDFENYLLNLNKIIEHLSNVFDKLYFKFHPRESEEIINKVKDIIKKPNLSYINDKRAVEDIIIDYYPKYAVSFSSAALVNLAFMGIEPVFLHNFIPNYQNIQSLNHFDSYLKSMNYNMITLLTQINPNYRSKLYKLQENSISIRDLIQK